MTESYEKILKDTRQKIIDWYKDLNCVDIYDMPDMDKAIYVNILLDMTEQLRNIFESINKKGE